MSRVMLLFLAAIFLALSSMGCQNEKPVVKEDLKKIEDKDKPKPKAY
jgi:hypothetical protein